MWSSPASGRPTRPTRGCRCSSPGIVRVLRANWLAAGGLLLGTPLSKQRTSTNIKMVGMILTAIDRRKKPWQNTKLCTARACPPSTSNLASLQKPSCSGQALMLERGPMFMTSGHTALSLAACTTGATTGARESNSGAASDRMFPTVVFSPNLDSFTQSTTSGATSQWQTESSVRQDVPYCGLFTQLGQLHTIYHIWCYKSMADRKQCREATWHYPEWNDIVANTVPLVNTMSTTILEPLEFSPTQ